MNFLFVIIFSLFFSLYSWLNYYVGLRIYSIVENLMPIVNSVIYWTLFWFLALSFIVARLGSKKLHKSVQFGLTRIGAYWLGAMFYFVLIFATADLLKLIDTFTGFIPESLKTNTIIDSVGGLLIILLVIGILVYGTMNAKNTKIRHYDVDIVKNSGHLSNLHIVMVSDIHLGALVNNRELKKMVDKINKLEPDIVLFAGDIIDENADIFVEQNMSDTLQKLRSKYGSFAVLGNHEFIGRSEEEIVYQLENADVKVLRDEYVKIADSFYLLGRNDVVMKQFSGKKRKDITEIKESLDSTLPIILMDHNPKYINESIEQGIDLQLSGHTHRGQLSPGNLITKKLFEIDWGYLSKGQFNIIVSSGYGTWGPPIRIGNSSEIVDITINFTAVDNKLAI